MSSNRIVFHLGFLLASCGTTPPKSELGTVDATTGTSGTPDADADGYDASEDCDDDNPAVHPEAEELCDGQDNDCDGLVDDADDDVLGTTTAYADTDGDAFGDPEQAVEVCAPGSGQSLDGTDCDDTSSEVYPGAPETWYDGVDGDCGGDSDYDADVDGFDADDWDGTDCDDTSSEVYPGAPETWYDGVDGDCGGDSDYDADGDGFDADDWDGTDCNDASSEVYPGAPETWYDGVDGDCGGDSDHDADGDGFDADAWGGTDCDDAVATTYTGATEVWYDGVDGDCGGDSDYDADGDGFDSDAWGGTDCDDAVATTYRGATEVWYDGVDGDCGGDSDYDADGDGFDAEAHGGTDCDDAVASTYTGATEVWYDGVDGDCGGDSDYDADGDGFDAEAHGGTDCDDAVASTYTGATEVWYDGVDGDCGGDSDYDADGDGFDSDAHGGTDCDDAVASTYTGATEVWYDGVDGDCGGDSDYDADGDGFDSDAWGGTDCDDAVASTYTGATEVWYDGVDGDCGGDSDYDADGDGFDGDSWGGTDCDDAVATTYTGATEVWYDGVDGDCGGDSDYDADGDGFDGDTWGGTDCDDAVATTYTGAAEMVNSTDDDCNGLIDDGTSAYDDDGDGYSEDAGDCDDDERLAVPGGTEICGDGIDNDCVDGDDSCSLSGSYAIADFGDERYGPNAWDFFGLAISVADFDGDGTEELTSASGFEPAYGHVWSEAPTGSAAADTDSWLVSYPSPYFNCNAYYAGPISPGDVNNDGYADLLGACASDTRSTGITYLVHGPITGPIDMGALAVATTVGEDWSSTAHLNEFGDLNNDGYDDLAIGAHLWNSSSYHGVGKMYIVYGPHSTNLDFSVDSADIELYPDDRDYQWMGDGAARAADFTGDGIPDLLQGHPWDDHNGTYSGSIAFFEGPVGSGSHVIYDADLDFIYGESAYDQLGGRLTVLNDIDGDGTPDLAVAAPGEALTMYGKVHVITDPPPYGQNIQDVASATVTGDWMAGSFGSAIEAADVDFDGQDDIVVGASNYGSGEEGAVYLFHGPLTGTLSASSADVFIEGTTADAGLGVELSRPSDLDGDGLLDLAIGAAYDDTHGASSGKMYLVYGL